MAAPRKFDEETRARAVRMYQDRILEHGDSMAGARRHVAALLDINPATLRNWVTRARKPVPPGTGDCFGVERVEGPAA